jgi:hypothetical protein
VVIISLIYNTKEDNIEYRQIAPYIPQTNEVVKRFNGTTKMPQLK